MRDYIYIWHEPESCRLVASGIEFTDVIPYLSDAGGVVLLDHRADDAVIDFRAGFDCVRYFRMHELKQTDISEFGDFIWVDFEFDECMTQPKDDAIAELLFFGRMGRPYKGVAIPGLGNRFLWWAHDDGWMAQFFYVDWNDVQNILSGLFATYADETTAIKFLRVLEWGESALLCKSGIVKCDKMFDMDAMQREYLL